MKIGYTPPAGAAGVSSKKRASGAGGTSFAGLMDSMSEAGEASAASETAATHGVGSVLSVQEVGGQGGGRKKARQAAGSLLESLDDLRHALLMGEVPGHVLHDIAERMTALRATTADGPLLDVIKEVEVRAAVELAKLEVSRRS